MINLNLTLIIQLAIVLVLFLFLSQIAFRPFLTLLQARKDRVEDDEKQARDLRERTEEMIERYREAMTAAQAHGAGMREEIRKESLAQEMAILQEAMREANQLLEEMKMKITQETEMAKSSLKQQAQILSREIATKILGRNLS